MSAGGIGLAEAVQAQRIERGYSARALSLEAGLSSSYVGKLEAGEIEPSVRAFARIARVLGMNQAEIAFCVMQEALHEPQKLTTKAVPGTVEYALSIGDGRGMSL